MIGNLGVDVGGVIIDRINDDSDTSFFGDNYLNTTAVPNVFAALNSLREVFPVIFLVSKCGERTQRRTLEWLEHNNFYDLTGIDRNHVLFCRKRNEKMPICEKFGIDYFVDDRLEILKSMDGVVKNLYLFNPNIVEVNKYHDYLPKVSVYYDWNLLAENLRKGK